MRKLLIISCIIVSILIIGSCTLFEPEPEEPSVNEANLEITTALSSWGDKWFIVNGVTYEYNGPIWVDFTWGGDDPFLVYVQGFYRWQIGDTIGDDKFETTLYMVDGDHKWLRVEPSMWY